MANIIRINNTTINNVDITISGKLLALKFGTDMGFNELATLFDEV